MPSILIISFVEWAGAFQRPQRIAMGFAARGWDVTYASPGYAHRKRKGVESGLATPPNLRVVSPLALPGASRARAVEQINDAAMRITLARVSPASGDKWDAILFNDPRWSTLTESLPAKSVIFDAMDDLSHAQSDPSVWLARLDHALKSSRKIWTGASIMAERLNSMGTLAKFIPNGVDYELFANPDPREVEKARSEIAASNHTKFPLAGFFGALNERIKAEYITALLEEGWRVALIGPPSSRCPKLPKHERLIVMGAKPYASLPAYLALMDLAIIPYDIEGAHRYLYPVKALEYLAGGKPVLSTPVPDLVKFLGEAILFGERPEDWRNIAREWETIKTDAYAKAARGQEFARRRSWNSMIDDMESELKTALAAGAL